MNQNVDQIVKAAENSEPIGEPLDLQITPVFKRNFQSRARITLNEGGVRSSKTISLAQLFLTFLYGEEQDATLTICRKTLPALKATAMKDFLNLMKSLNLYDERKHNKTDHIYREGSNEIEFLAVDEEQKVRGRKRRHLWMNEANEFEEEDFKQLVLRTTGRVYMDFNPVDEEHWIFRNVMTRSDAKIIHSDYRDNPFLEPAIVQEIERMREGDPNYWAVFGLGKRPAQGSKIYSHYTLVDAMPKVVDEMIAGLDFGFNNPSALIRIGIKERTHTWDELIYETNLTNRDLFWKMNDLRNEGLLTSTMPIYADAAEPDRIQELCEGMRGDDGQFVEGFNVLPADKAVKAGIDFIKGRPLEITKRSTNLLDNMRKYLWKTTKDGKILDEPVKANDHGPDAGRYGEFTHGKDLAEGGPNIRILGQGRS